MVRVSLIPVYRDAISTSRKTTITARRNVSATSLQFALCPKMMPSTAENRVSTNIKICLLSASGASHNGTSTGYTKVSAKSSTFDGGGTCDRGERAVRF